MADYAAASGDTFASLAKKFFGDEAAAKPLALYNKTKDDSQPPTVGTVLSIPSRLYGEKSRQTSDGKTTVALTLFVKKAGDVMIFFSPALKKYYVLEAAKDNAFSVLSDEANATKELAQKILDGWQGRGFASMLTAMQDLSREAETFFEGLKNAPKDAIDELIAVTKHPDWDESFARLFVRPKRIAGVGTWKEATDASVHDLLESLRESDGDTGLASDALSALCPGAQNKGAWPWQWKFSDAQATASGAAPSFSSAVAARFVRKDRGGVHQFAGGIDHRHLNTGADAWVQAHHYSRSGRSRQQQVAQIVGKHLDRHFFSLLAQAGKEVTLGRQAQLDAPSPGHTFANQVIGRSALMAPAQMHGNAAFGQGHYRFSRLGLGARLRLG
jgi:hypothetical protein